jgi:hypothetical protein
MSRRFFDAYVPSVSSGRHHHLFRLAAANVPVVLAAAIVRSPATVTEKDPRSFGRPREWPAWHRPMTARVEKFVRARDQTWRNEIGDPRSSSRSKQNHHAKGNRPSDGPSSFSSSSSSSSNATARREGSETLVVGRAEACRFVLVVAGAAASVFGTARERTACASPRSPSLSPPPL